jgi:hydroxymethylbilane synthase
MSSPIRIGTRDSKLALWQAHKVKYLLEELGHGCELVPVKSQGDLKLDKPLYELGITGVFTKTLDLALLKEEIDIAVHSMKDVPTLLARGLKIVAVLERACSQDVLVHKGVDLKAENLTIATSSLRRKAQWLAKFPTHKIVDIRGNVQTRLQKLEDHPWDGAIFAKAGLDRLDIKLEHSTVLDWMVPAPAQGAMVVLARESDKEMARKLKPLNHTNTARCVTLERYFLQTLEGGCTAPIGGLATIHGGTISFKGCLHDLDGSTHYEVEDQMKLEDTYSLGKKAAIDLLAMGGDELMEKIRKQTKR